MEINCMFIDAASDRPHLHVTFNMHGMWVKEPCISVMISNGTGNKEEIEASSPGEVDHCSLPTGG